MHQRSDHRLELYRHWTVVFSEVEASTETLTAAFRSLQYAVSHVPRPLPIVVQVASPSSVIPKVILTPRSVLGGGERWYCISGRHLTASPAILRSQTLH